MKKHILRTTTEKKSVLTANISAHDMEVCILKGTEVDVTITTRITEGHVRPKRSYVATVSLETGMHWTFDIGRREVAQLM